MRAHVRVSSSVQFSSARARAQSRACAPEWANAFAIWQHWARGGRALCEAKARVCDKEHACAAAPAAAASAHLRGVQGLINALAAPVFGVAVWKGRRWLGGVLAKQAGTVKRHVCGQAALDPAVCGGGASVAGQPPKLALHKQTYDNSPTERHQQQMVTHGRASLINVPTNEPVSVHPWTGGSREMKRAGSGGANAKFYPLFARARRRACALLVCPALHARDNLCLAPAH